MQHGDTGCGQERRIARQERLAQGGHENERDGASGSGVG